MTYKEIAMADEMTSADVRDVLTMLEMGDVTEDEAVKQILGMAKEAGAEVEED